MYLVLALFWSVVGVALLAWRWFNPQAEDLALRWTNISAGWFALGFAAYNLVRWWSARTLRRQESLRAEHQRPVQRFNTIKPADVPDPTFNFDEPPEADKAPPR